MTPQRIQLSRRKGWQMPDNTVKVDHGVDVQSFVALWPREERDINWWLPNRSKVATPKPDETTRLCNLCNTPKPIGEFPKCGSGFGRRCKPCHNEANKKYVAKRNEDKKRRLREKYGAMTEMTCRSCAVTKPMDEFPVRSDARSLLGRHTRCRDCTNRRQNVLAGRRKAVSA